MLADLDPDVVVTQDLCAVCAVDVSVVDDALAFLGCRAKVVTIDPHLGEVDESILRLGEVTGRRASSRALVSSIQQRMTHVADRVKARPRPRVAVEVDRPAVRPRALDPGDGLVGRGDPVIGAAGAASRRISWDDVKAAQPDVVVIAACGYDRQGTALAHDLASRGVLPRRFGSLRWMRTRRGRVQAPGWLTVLRSLPISSTRRPTRPWPSARRPRRADARHRRRTRSAGSGAAHPQPADGYHRPDGAQPLLGTVPRRPRKPRLDDFLQLRRATHPGGWPARAPTDVALSPLIGTTRLNPIAPSRRPATGTSQPAVSTESDSRAEAAAPAKTRRSRDGCAIICVCTQIDRLIDQLAVEIDDQLVELAVEIFTMLADAAECVSSWR